MKTFPWNDEAGQLFAFEISNIYFLSSASIGKFLVRCPGVEIDRVRQLFEVGNEVHVEFSYHGDEYVVWEPFGDNSRYWIGLKDNSGQPTKNIQALELFVLENWPGPISAALGKLFSALSKRNVA